MKTVNQIIHQTDHIDKLKSIVENGFYCSYALEQFSDKKLLIPMISFSNILFRDIGSYEVVDYGSYGIGIDRESAIKLGLNPVLYLYENGIIEKGIKDNFDFSILPQTLEIVKEFYKKCDCENITKYINFNPLPNEVKNLINSISAQTSDKVISSIKELFGSVFENSYRQILLAKPYKIKTKSGDERIAYNEREWRKSFFDLHFIYELKPNGEVNPDFSKWINTNKPHLKESKHTFKIPIELIKYLIVKKDCEKIEMESFIKDCFGSVPPNIKIETLNKLKESEK